MPEGLSASEVGKEISEHHERATGDTPGRERLISIVEAVLLSIVALPAAWSGYAAAATGPRAGPHRAVCRHFSEGESGAGTADKYVRLTVLLAASVGLVDLARLSASRGKSDASALPTTPGF